MIFRYRKTFAEQRQQIKWVVFGTAALILLAYAQNPIAFELKQALPQESSSADSASLRRSP